MCRDFEQISFTATQSQQNRVNCQVELSVGQTIRIDIAHNSTTKTSSATYGYTDMQIARLPSSSELVVTPETQNVWGVIQGNGNDSVTASSTYVTPSFFTITSTKGKCEADSTNMACKIAYLPAGSYRVTATVPYLVQNTTGQSSCHVQIADNKGSGILTTQQIVTGFASNAANSGVNVSRTFTYTSAQTNVVFSFQHKKVLGSACGVYTSSVDRYFEITVQPLDNASNSALYVQGPVKAAGTGAAIPAGYVGEKIEATGSSISVSTSATTITSLSLTPGVWSINFNAFSQFTASNAFECGVATAPNSTTGWNTLFNYAVQVGATSSYPYAILSNYYVSVTTTTPYYLTCRLSSGTVLSNGRMHAIRIN